MSRLTIDWRGDTREATSDIRECPLISATVVGPAGIEPATKGL
jgi:hypothetical protein